MNKTELADAVAERAGLSKTDAGKAVDATFDAITAALIKEDDVRLIGFGTFHAAKREESKGRNPRTGEEMTIPAQKMAKFKPGKGLKDSLNP